MKLEDIQPDAILRGILPDALVTVVSVAWHGSDALTLVYHGHDGRVADEILYRHYEPRLEVVESGRPWSFDGDGSLFRLVSEAHRIRLAHLFDPVLAVHGSLVDPLPHQITAVYEAMLPRQPLRFLLADDPGSGKTIMAGLLIKKLIARGDLKRCLVVCPGSLAEQWQDELSRRFHLPFEILTNDELEAARTGNGFLENDLVIARLDKLSRNEDVQQKLGAPDCRYDLVVCDEAHKLSATFFGGEVKYTKRYRLGQLLSGLTRHFLLLDGHAAQRQGRRLPAFPRAARQRPLRGTVPRRRPPGRGLRPVAPRGGAGAHHRAGGARARRRGARTQAPVDREDPRRSEGSPHQGDHLLGPPRRRAQAPGAGRQGRRAPQLAGGPPSRRRPAGPARAPPGELDREAQISALPPVVLGGVIVVPLGLIAAMTGRAVTPPASAADTQASAARARAAVMETERARLRAHRPRARPARLRHREPRPRHGPAALHRGQGTGDRRGTGHGDEERDPHQPHHPDDFILALVEFLDGDTHRVRYLRRPFQHEPDFGVASVNYDFAELSARAGEPR